MDVLNIYFDGAWKPASRKGGGVVLIAGKYRRFRWRSAQTSMQSEFLTAIAAARLATVAVRRLRPNRVVIWGDNETVIELMNFNRVPKKLASFRQRCVKASSSIPKLQWRHVCRDENYPGVLLEMLNRPSFNASAGLVAIPFD